MPTAGLGYKSDAILKHHHTGGLLSLVLRRHVHPVITRGSRIDLAGPGELRDGTLRHVRLPLGVGTNLVVLGTSSTDETGNEHHDDDECACVHERQVGATHWSSASSAMRLPFGHLYM